MHYLTKRLVRCVAQTLQHDPEISRLERRRRNVDHLLLVTINSHRLPRLIVPDHETIGIKPFETIVDLLAARAEIRNFHLNAQQVIALHRPEIGYFQAIDTTEYFQLAQDRPSAIVRLTLVRSWLTRRVAKLANWPFGYLLK